MNILITGGSGFIGTNLVEHLVASGHAATNIDIVPPKDASHARYWQSCDIMDQSSLYRTFGRLKPTHVVHLAARSDVEGRTIEEYDANTKGTFNVLMAVKATPSIDRLIVTSTQFVHQFHGLPLHDEDYIPFTVYGESKVIAEKYTRQAGLDCVWSIIRPTNIWGPWHPRYPFEFWKTLSQGVYVHPGKGRVIRSYGYVGNVVWQILKILNAPRNRVDRKVFYVGDKPVELYDWVNGFSMQMIGKRVRTVPQCLVRILAMTGDMLKMIGANFPINTSRYRSMTTSNPAPMEATFKELGMPPYSLEDGIRETVAWMKKYYPNLVRR